MTKPAVPAPGRYTRGGIDTRRKRKARAGVEHVDVNSSFIDSLDWDGDTLWVNIGANSYWYPGTSSKQFQDFCAAASKGAFYNAQVKLPRGGNVA